MKNQHTLRAGGASPIIIGISILVIAAIAVLGNLSDWYGTHQLNVGAILIPMICLLFISLAFIYYFLLLNIKFKEDILSIYPGNRPFVFNWSNENKSNKAINIHINDISGIFVGNLRELNKLATLSPDKLAQETISYWKNSWLSTSIGLTPLILAPFPAWVVTQFSVIMFIRSKDSGKSVVVSLKPFSKKGVNKFLKFLKSKGVQIVVQPSLGI